MSDEAISESEGILPRKHRGATKSHWKRLLAFCGPGYMIAVGYMDPGNWATDIEAGSKYAYKLLFVVLLSNAMAMILQHLAIRLGVVTGKDLAEACRAHTPKWLNLILYVLAEVAIVACDLAEVIGTAIALKLLFGIPVRFGVLLTALDVIFVLSGFDKKNFRFVETVVIVLVAVISICFTVELFLVKPNLKHVMEGFLPTADLFKETRALELALGIIGATVMPHNLYLHSSIVKNRSKLENSKMTLRLATMDSSIALMLAFFVNAAILVTCAAAFNVRGFDKVTSIEDACELLKDILGPAAKGIFGLALLAAGQSSTVTGTMAGQIVFEGFLQLRLKPWVRRLLTRMVAILPAVLIVFVLGEEMINDLLIYSQIVLSFQLPFAVIPLVYLTSSRHVMGQHANPLSLKAVAVAVSALILALNIALIVQGLK